jgi:chromosome partitioning protein
VQTLAVINQKGGCGKTTTAISLAGFFAARGWRTLLVDMDPQSHCAAGLAIPEARIDLSIADAMLAAEVEGAGPPVNPDRLLWRVSRNLDLAPSDMKLAGLEAARGGLATGPDPERRLARVIGSLADRYDLAIIDCSPAIGLLAYNALVAAEHVLIPVETGFFSLQGATKQVNTIRALAKRLNVAPSHRLLPTMHDPASALARDLLEELHRRFPGKVAPVAVRYDRALKEAASFGQPVGEYAPESAGAEDYRAVTEWLAEHVLRRTSMRGGLEAIRPAEPVVVGAPLPAGTADGAAENETGGNARALDIVERARRMQQRAAASAPVEPKPEADATPQRPGVYATEGGVLFVQPAAMGQRIEIAGDFNGWNPAAAAMQLNPARGVFELFVPLPPGVVQYRLVVDGRWMADPFNPSATLNPSGEPISLVQVPAPLPPVAAAG